ncbi:unnamed protein product [Zymoseptoria tritici ST99CH_3D1]|uniref:Uncharacterized protein n=1 Tax=Zymoseptoria tritici (strain ST99CH_3D7) TaxID=1276538 RepID=A0A1X7RXT9_ZYMT9|nr:unnamed protein product [Zymoseptoria tritici ST99CH_3D7]SMR57462.1 unnamed protein product [Zymoseptoria tritici ST99CH_3D1]
MVQQFQLLVAASMLAPVFAVPSSRPSALVRRQETCRVQRLDEQGNIEELAVQVGFYSDQNCENYMATSCIYTGRDTYNGSPGDYSCSSANTPPGAPYYVKVLNSGATYKPSLQVLFTRDQSCPPSGPGQVYATLVNNEACVQLNLGGSAPGISVYPNGGAAIARVGDNVTVVDEEPRMRKRQANTKCDGFITDSQQPSTSRTEMVSNIIDCTNGASNGCMITVGEQMTKSFSTSFSLSAGGGIEGIFSVETTFGLEYTESTTTSIQNGFSVAAGQKGYIGAYSSATLFTGRFTGCDQGDAEQAGQTLAIFSDSNRISYSIIATGAV